VDGIDTLLKYDHNEFMKKTDKSVLVIITEARMITQYAAHHGSQLEEAVDSANFYDMCNFLKRGSSIVIEEAMAIKDRSLQQRQLFEGRHEAFGENAIKIIEHFHQIGEQALRIHEGMSRVEEELCPTRTVSHPPDEEDHTSSNRHDAETLYNLQIQSEMVTQEAALIKKLQHRLTTNIAKLGMQTTDL
jgi:hypothetical protein